MSVLPQTEQSPSEETLQELSRLTAEDWIIAGTIILGAIVIGFVLRSLAMRSLAGRSGRLMSQLIGRLVLGIAVVFGVVYALNQVGVSMTPLLGLLGVLGLAFALAFQDVLSNFIAGVMLSVRRPFRVGDEIRAADFDGVVEDVSLRFVTMRAFDGVRVFIPNSTVWEGPIENYTTLGSRRSELKIGIGYDTDLDGVKGLVVEAVSSVDGVRDQPLPEVFVKEFGESAIDLSVFFWHHPTVAEELRTRDGVVRGVKQALEAADIEIPFPQLVIRPPGGSGV